MRKLHDFIHYRANHWRTWYWSRLSTFGRHVRVLGRVVIYHPQNLYVGAHSTLNEGVVINAREKVVIGSRVHISPGVIINAGGLEVSRTMEERTHTALPVCIEDGVWIGSGAIVNPGVTIGKNSVIAAGAVVTKDIPASSVAAGMPARVVKSINE